MFLHFKDHFYNFKFHAHSFLNNSKLRGERDIWFERRGYNLFFMLE